MVEGISVGQSRRNAARRRRRVAAPASAGEAVGRAADAYVHLGEDHLRGGWERGGDRLRLRHDVAYMNAVGTDLIPDPRTAGEVCRRFTEADVTALMDTVV